MDWLDLEPALGFILFDGVDNGKVRQKTTTVLYRTT